MIYIGWMLSAFLLGFLIAYICKKEKQSKTLAQRFSAVSSFYGKSLADIQRLANNAPYSVNSKANGQTLRTWQDNNYTITLLFDVCDICLGVEQENSKNN